MPSLTDDDRGQRHARTISQPPPGASRRATAAPSPDRERLDAGDDRPAERDGDPDPDLEVAACRPTRCRTGSGRTARRPPPGPGSPRRSPRRSRPGPSRARRSRAGSPGRSRSPSRRAAGPRPRPGPRVRTADRAALRLDDPDGLLDRALLVRADREAEEPGVDRLPVGGQDDPAAGRGHALDADEDVHRRVDQLRIRLFSGSNSGVAPATATVTG